MDYDAEDEMMSKAYDVIVKHIDEALDEIGCKFCSFAVDSDGHVMIKVKDGRGHAYDMHMMEIELRADMSVASVSLVFIGMNADFYVSKQNIMSVLLDKAKRGCICLNLANSRIMDKSDTLEKLAVSYDMYAQ